MRDFSYHDAAGPGDEAHINCNTHCTFAHQVDIISLFQGSSYLIFSRRSVAIECFGYPDGKLPMT